MHFLSSSVRELDPRETFERTRAMARRLGVTRVTDITRLDRIGIPVYAGIRPNARPGSLCVNAGKGLTPDEARAGAVAEAVEFAAAEYGFSAARAFPGSPRDVLGGGDDRLILEFCPVMGARVDLDQPVSLTEAEELFTGTRVLVPAELVWLPFPDDDGHPALFGNSSNGLAAGNSVAEATVHALYELIERDVRSFRLVRDTSALVRPESLPEPARACGEAVRAAHLELHVRTVANPFGLAYFESFVYDPSAPDALYFHAGYGCHADPVTAVTRSVCEAAQSRLSFIHGGRDDLEDRFRHVLAMPEGGRRRYADDLICDASSARNSVAFDRVARRDVTPGGTDSIVSDLLGVLKDSGFRSVCRVVLTDPGEPLQVVRVIVPGLEFFEPTARRVGRRLRDYASDA